MRALTWMMMADNCVFDLLNLRHCSREDRREIRGGGVGNSDSLTISCDELIILVSLGIVVLREYDKDRMLPVVTLIHYS